MSSSTAAHPAAHETSHPQGVRLIVRHGSATDVGQVRGDNEDSLLADSPVFLVADGMGGHRLGGTASAHAVRAFEDLVGRNFVTSQEFSRRLTRAARSVAALGAGERAPGSTLTGLLLCRQGALPCLRVVNIGDSRTYHLSAQSFSQITHDHSEVQELIDSGHLDRARALSSCRRNVITRALGAGGGDQVVADQYLLPATVGDRFIICSDGLSGYVAGSLIEMVARSVPDPRNAAQELVALALATGGRDNVTVIVVDVVEAFPPWENTQVDDITLPRATGSGSGSTVPAPVSRRSCP